MISWYWNASVGLKYGIDIFGFDNIKNYWNIYEEIWWPLNYLITTNTDTLNTNNNNSNTV